MKTLPFLESSCNPRKVPSIFAGGIAVSGALKILRSQDPSIIWKAPQGIRPFVAVDLRPSRRNTNRRVVGVERKLPFVLNEMKQVDVRPAKLLFAIDAKSKIPNYPTACRKASGR